LEKVQKKYGQKALHAMLFARTGRTYGPYVRAVLTACTYG